MNRINRRKDWGKLSPDRTFGPLYVECAGFGISRKLADALALHNHISAFFINDECFVELASLRNLIWIAAAGQPGDIGGLNVPLSSGK